MWGLLAVVQLAQAGGPWVPGEGSAAIYVGSNAQRIDQLALSDGSLVDVGEGLSKFYVQGIVTYGLTARTALELDVPWARVWAHREEAQTCLDLSAAVGHPSCSPTQGIGIISLRGRTRVLDELGGAPVTVSIGGEVRHGDLTAATRDKLTNLGEGTFDFGPTLSVGRTGSLGKGYYYAFVDSGYRYRLPLTERNDVAIPGWEVQGEADVAFVPDGIFGIGPAFLWFARPNGVDFEKTDLTDEDRFSMLRVTNLSAGAKVLVRSSERSTLVVSVLRTVYARNNPIVWSAGFGLQVEGFMQRDGG